MPNQQLLNDITNRLIKAYQPIAIYLFGSYAWGSPRPDSDFDLMVIVNESNEKNYKRPKKGLLALSGLHIAKDLVVYTAAEFSQRAHHASSLCRRIQQEGIKLYATT
jgi:predicted nucleotidyltransferase